MSEDAITIDDFDSDGVTGLGVFGILDLGETAFAKGLAKLVIANASAGVRQGGAHFKNSKRRKKATTAEVVGGKLQTAMRIEN